MHDNPRSPNDDTKHITSFYLLSYMNERRRRYIRKPNCDEDFDVQSRIRQIKYNIDKQGWGAIGKMKAMTMIPKVRIIRIKMGILALICLLFCSLGLFCIAAMLCWLDLNGDVPGKHKLAPTMKWKSILMCAWRHAPWWDC